jgi:uncharacterized membrane protein YfcA
VSIESGLILLAVAGFLAYVVRGVTGGASAIAFNALFSLGLAFGLAGGLTLLDGLYWVAIGDLVTGFVLLVTLRAHIRFEPFLTRFLLVSLPINVGCTLLLPRLDVGLLTLGLGVTLVLAGLYLAFRRNMGHWSEHTLMRRALPFGIAAGTLGGLYGMAGPVTVVYLIQAGSDTGRFRARLTLLSVFWSSFRVLTLLLTGALTPERLIRFGLTLPFVLGGLAVGYRLHPRVSPDAFRIGLGALVAITGAILVVDTLLG